MKNVLVTGGAGYIGSHTAKALFARGYQPVVLDNLYAGHRWAVQWGPLIVGDISDASLVKTVVESHQIEAVIHFAAYAYVGESMRAPEKYFRNNVSGSLQLLDALLGSGVRHVVFSSSCATYGIPQTLPISEEHQQQPINPYGESKLFIERALGWYDKAHSLRSVCLRYFNAAGADPDGDVGECHDPETHLIPLAIQAALCPQRPLLIFGSDYDTEDGTAVRDYVHVCDLAEAHVSALDYLLGGGESTAINLGTGRGHSVRDVQKALERVCARPVAATVNERRAGDPAVLVAAADKAKRLLGWEPRFRELETIIETAWRWHNSRTHGGFRPE